MSTPRSLDLPPGARPLEIPLPGGGHLAALEAHPPAEVRRRRPAVLVPGYTGSKEDFIPVLGPLAAGGHRVLALDLPGQYESPGPDDPEHYTFETLACAAAYAVREAGAPAHLLGHSFGGLVARTTALAGDVALASLTLMDSGPQRIEGPRAAEAQGMLHALGPAPTRALLADLWHRHLSGPLRARGLPEPIECFVRERMLANTPAALVGMARELTTAPDRTAELAAAGTPLLVLYGEHDDVWSPCAQAAMAERLAARRAVIPAAAHSPAVEAPEATARALAGFWAEAEGG